MTKDNNSEKKSLLLIADALADDIINTPDNEFIKEMSEDGKEIAAGVNFVDSILSKAQTNMKKNRMFAIRKEIETHKTNKINKTISIQEARKQIEEALKRNKDNKDTTLAARYGEGVPDEDILDLYEDLCDLDMISEE